MRPGFRWGLDALADRTDVLSGLPFNIAIWKNDAVYAIIFL